MAKASRSSRKQPAFDPSEIEDLIFSPAVGSGVGSHLLGPKPDFPAPGNRIEEGYADLSTVAITATVAIAEQTTAVASLLPTVDMYDGDQPGRPSLHSSILKNSVFIPSRVLSQDQNMATVAITDMSTVDDMATVDNSSAVLPALHCGDAPHISTGVSDMTTVGISDKATVAKPDAAGTHEEAAVPTERLKEIIAADETGQGREAGLVPPELIRGQSNATTVAMSELAPVHSAEPFEHRPPKNVLLWITEQGDLVPQARVKRIRLAQDVINSAEESVYDTLWSAKGAQNDDDREPSRVIQAGYDYLVKRTRLSKKTIQRIIAKLLDKDFIAIERPADIYQRTSTVYRVFSYKAVLDRHIQKGRSHVAKIGPGFSYVRSMDDPRGQPAEFPAAPAVANPASTPNLSTMVIYQTPTVVTGDLSAEANRTTDTVVGSNPSTVVRASTIYIDKNVLDTNTSSSSSAVYQALTQYGAVDDDILARLIRDCKQQAPDCTEEEIIHFIEAKGSLIRGRDSRIYSPIGFLLTAVPKCFTGEVFRFYREEQRKLKDAADACEAKRQAELHDWRREQEARLADPSVSEEDKKFIHEYLGIGYR
jgi:hypothetical protein